jgi:hypothetical protein
VQLQTFVVLVLANGDFHPKSNPTQLMKYSFYTCAVEFTPLGTSLEVYNIPISETN